MVEVREQEGRTHGWLYQNEEGKKRRSVEFEEDLHIILETIQRTTSYIDDKVNVREEFGIFRSFRRGATTEAHNHGVAEPVIEMNSRWRKIERAKGKKASMTLSQH